jgi:hypothetical protein
MPSILRDGYSIGTQVYTGINTGYNLLSNFHHPANNQNLGHRGGLDAFVSSINSKDLARTAHFRVAIYRSKSQKFNSRFSLNDLTRINMLCDSTTLPDVATVPITASVGSEVPYDIVNKIAYATQSASFYVSSDMFQKKFFDDWIELSYVKFAGQPAYYDDYTTTMDIFQLKHSLDEKLTGDNDWTYKTTLYNVYPKSVSPMTLDWSSSNAVQKISVTFHYTHWDSETNS